MNQITKSQIIPKLPGWLSFLRWSAMEKWSRGLAVLWPLALRRSA
jgi:hypothetical protein